MSAESLYQEYTQLEMPAKEQFLAMILKWLSSRLPDSEEEIVIADNMDQEALLDKLAEVQSRVERLEIGGPA